MKEQLFHKVCDIIGREKDFGYRNFMKTVHSVLKNYYEANELNQEVKIGTEADICNGKKY